METPNGMDGGELQDLTHSLKYQHIQILETLQQQLARVFGDVAKELTSEELNLLETVLYPSSFEDKEEHKEFYGEGWTEEAFAQDKAEERADIRIAYPIILRLFHVSESLARFRVNDLLGIEPDVATVIAFRFLVNSGG